MKFAFIGLAGAALALVVGMLVRALWRKGASPADDGSLSLAVLRDQQSELDAETRAGLVAPDLADEQQSNLEIAALEVARTPGPVSQAPASPPTAWIVAVATGVPAIAVIVYLTLGSPELLTSPPMALQSPHGTDEARVDDMIRSLSARLEARPDDADGWQLLGRSLASRGDFAGAVRAFAEAGRRGPEDAQLLADWADSLAMVQGRSLAGKPTELIERALTLDGRHPKTLALAATAALNRGDQRGAAGFYRRFLAELPPGSPDADSVRGLIASLENPQAPAAVPGTPRAASAAATHGSVAGTVSIAPQLAARVSPSDTVFLFARAANGPRMPLAVLRLQASELPRAYVLDDSMGMTGAPGLSQASEVRIEARVSRSGSATPQRGDLSGTSGVVRPGARDVPVVIDRVVD